MNIIKVFTASLLAINLISSVWAAPTLTTNLNQNAFIGEQACFSAEFTNTGSDAGFGPYVLMTLPAGIDPTTLSATLFEGKTTLSVTDLGIIDASAVPALTDDYSGESFTTPDGFRLARIVFPVGSLTQESPPLDLNICATLPTTVAPNDLQQIQLTPIYRFGASATGTTALLGTPTNASEGLNPVLAIVKKENDTPEGELTPGPSFPFTYTLAVDIANGQTLTNINLSDALPANFQWTGTSATDISVSNGNCSPTTLPNTDPTPGDIVNTGDNPGGSLVITCANVTGTANASHNPLNPNHINGGEDIIVSIRGYITETLDETTCGTENIDNSVSFNSEYQGNPLTAQTATDRIGLNAKPTAVQKGVDNTTPEPGNTLTYTLNFQITDYEQTIASGNSASVFEIVDVMPDGLTFDAASVVLTIDGTTVPITPTTVDNQGETTVTYNIAAAAQSAGVALDASTTGNIIYTANVDQTYEGNGGTTGESVNSNDPLVNRARLNYQLADNTTAQCTDMTSERVLIKRILPNKTILNSGNPSMAQPPYQAGDIVYYQIQMTIESGDAENVVMKDILPLPVHLVGDLPTTLRVGTSENDTDASNIVYFASPDNSVAGVSIANYPPVVTTSISGNSVSFAFGDISVAPTQPITLTVNIPAVVSDEPFSDGLTLANLLQVSSENTNSEPTTDTGITNVTTVAPDLTLTKGVMQTNGNGTIAPAVSNEPVDGNLTGADAGDSVTYRITVENTGSASAFDVTITDPVRAGLTGCSVASVTDGSGSNIVYTDSSTSTSIALTLSNDALGSGLGALAGNDDNPNGGGAPYANDTAFVDVTCALANNVTPNQVIENTASVQWSSRAGSTLFPAKEDTATITIARPDIAKSIVAVSPNATGSSDFSQVTGGDTVTYDILVTLPEGTTSGLNLADTLPAGFDAQTVTLVTTATNSTLLNNNFNGAASITSGNALPVTFNSVTVNADNNTDNNAFVVRVTALVDGTDSANDGTPAQTKTNTVTLTYDNQAGGIIRDTATTNYVEPELTVTKSVDNNSDIEPGDTLVYTIDVENTGTAPAYDMSMTDNLSSLSSLVDLTTLTNANITVMATGFSCNYTNPTVTCNQNTGQRLDVGATATFELTVTVANNAFTGSIYTNTASATGYSQEDDTNTERSETTDDGSVNVSTSAPEALSKTVLDTSEAWTTGSQVAIGEIITYQLVYTLPEGITRSRNNNVIFQDVLPTGFEYVAGTARYRAVYDNNLTGANAPNAPLAITDTPITPVIINIPNNPTGQPRRLRFNFGDITNNDRDADAEQVIFTFDVRVKNTSDNNLNGGKTNRAWVLYRNANGNNLSERAQRTVRIAEPNLNIQKTASPTTAAGGATITFTVVVSNPNARRVTRAWEPLISDTLPAEYSNLSITSATLNSPSTSRNNVDIASCVTTVALPSPPRQRWILDGDEATCVPAQTGNDYLAPNETITVVYTATLDPAVNFEQVVTNTATVSASSLPNASANSGAEDGERDGSGGVNDLTVADSASVTADKPSITKTVADDTLQIGEKTTVTIEVSIPRGETQSFVLSDNLPAGLRYTGTAITITPPATNFTATNSPSTTPSAGTDPLVFDFGNIQNSATTSQTLTIEYEVEVENVIGNQRMTNLTNTVTANYTGADSNNLPSASDVITVLEPNLEIAKSIVTGATGSNAGDTVRYRLEIENTDASATAYRVDIRDVLPEALLGGSPTFTLTSLNLTGAVTRNDNGNTLAVGDAVIGTTTNTDDTLSFPLVDMPPSSKVTVEYDATLINTAVTGSTVTNILTTTYSSEQDGNGRNSNDSTNDDDSNLNNYGETTAQDLTLGAAIALSKSLAAGQLDNEFTIGEEVVFDLTVSLSEGVTRNVALRDVLPDGLTLVGLDGIVASSNISYTGAGTASGVGSTVDPIVVTLGDVTNTPDNDTTNDTLVVQLRTRVANDIGNQNTDTLTNNATLTSALSTRTADTDIEIVEPLLDVSKTVDNATPSLGEEVTFTVEVSHQTGSASDAFDIVLTDTLPTGLTYVSGSVAGPVSVDASDMSKPIFTVSSVTLTDRSKTFTYRARVSDSATVGQALTNTIAGTYSGLSGDNANERDGDDGAGGLNDYVLSDDATVTPRIVSVIDAQKTVAIAVDNGTAGIADVGDTLEYAVTLTNTGITPVTNVIFTDTIPANTTLVANSLTTDTGTPVEANPLMVNNIASLAPNATVTITFRVTINSGTPTGTIISNQGSVDSNETVPEPTDVDGVDSNGDQPTDIPVGGNPDLANPLDAEKAVELWIDANNNGAVNPGDTLRYTIVLNNKGNTVLTNVSLNDVIPTGLTYVSGTAVASASNADVIVSGQNLTWGTNTPMAIPAGGFVNLVFDVTVNNPLDNSRGDGDANNEAFDNQADVAYVDGTTNKTTQTDGNGNPSDGNQPTNITATTGTGAPQLDVQKRVILASDNDNNGVANPNDTLTYTITIVNNGSAATDNARFSDSIPTQTSLVAGSVTTDYGVVTSGNAEPITVNLGNLKPGEVATVRFTVTVNAGTGGQTASNQASVSGDNFTSVNSDDNGNLDDGINPTLTPIYDNSNPAPTAVKKDIVDTSESDSIGNNVLIGEIVTYEVTVTVPSGTLSEVSIVDTLPTGLRYIAGSAQLKRVFTTGLNAAANPESINSEASNSYVSLTDGTTLQQNTVSTGNQLSVFLGDVINSDSAAASYTLRYQAVVKNIASNTNGTASSNSATLSYLTGLNQPASLTPVGQAVSVIEPDVSVSKSASPTVILTTGGTVTYNIEVTNNGTAPAYDISISDDTLPSGWTITNTTLGTITNGNDLQATITTLSNVAPNNTQTITITATSPTTGLSEGDTITNTAGATWTSLPGTNGTANATQGNAGDEDGERTGGTGTGSNGYATSGSADVKVGTPSLTKTVRNPKTHYAIGDLVQYQLELTVPAGLNMTDAVISDVLDEGLLYIAGSLNVTTDALTLDAQPSDFSRADNIPNTGEETLTFNTAGIENEQSDARTLTLIYSARVENIVANQNGDSLGNKATVTYTNPGNASDTLTLSDNKSITIGEPHLALGKTITTPTTNLDAGDSVTYQVTVTNDGTTTAFDTVLSDSLPLGLESITALTIDSTIPANLTRPTFIVSGANDTTWSSSAFDLGVNESLTMTFTVSLANTVTPGDTLQNRVNAVFTSQSGPNVNERDGNLSDNADQDNNTASDSVNNYDVTTTAPTITVADPIQFDKAFNPTTKTAYAIGEIVAYRLTLQLAEGTLDDVVITDTLPSGLTFVDGTVGLGNTNMTTANAATVNGAGQIITANLGQVVNPANTIDTDDFITVDIRARVDNITANQAGTVLGNNARVDYSDANGAQTRDFDADANTSGVQPLDLTIVEPNLTVSKTASVADISLGDVVTYEITVAHDNSTATAYDITVTDNLPTGMTYVANSGTPAPTVNGQVLTFNVANLTQSTASTTITYQARMNTGTAVGATQTNKATMTYASQPDADGTINSGRNGKDGEGAEDTVLNNYVDSATADVTPTVNAVIDAQKTVAIVVDKGTVGIADAGDTLEYTVTLTNTGKTLVTNVVFTDTIPTNTTYIVGSVNAAGAASASESGGVVTVNYDELSAGSSVTITFEVAIDANTVIGTTITNQGSVDSDQTVPEATDVDGFDDDGDEPTTIQVGGTPNSDNTLSVSKTYRIVSDTVAPMGTNNVGDVVAYDIVVQNTGSSPLTNVFLRDTIPVGVTVTAINSSKGNVAVSNSMNLDLGTLAAGESVTVTIIGTLNAVGMMENQATVSTNELTDVLSDSDGDANNGAQPTRFPVLASGTQGTPKLALDKAMTLASDSNTDGSVNPGELVRTSIVLRNTGSAAANNVELRDDLSTLNATLVDYSITTSQGAVVSYSPVLIVNVGTVLPGTTVVVTFLVNADSVGTIDNTATANDNSGQNVSDFASVPVTAFAPFDPPLGEKIVNADDIPELAWKQVWINPNDSYFMPVRIVDSIPANSTYVENSINCEARGISAQARCDFDAAMNQVVFEGQMGADGNATTEDTAQNEVVITFRVTVDNLAQRVSNQAEAQWDGNGNGSLSDDNGVALSNDPATDVDFDPTVWIPDVPEQPQPVPMLGRYAFWVLCLLFIGIVWRQYRRRNVIE